MNNKVNEAMQSIESAMNAAVSKGVFVNLESAAYIFNCIKVLKDELKFRDSVADTD